MMHRYIKTRKENIIFDSKVTRIILIYLYNCPEKKDYILGISKAIKGCYGDIIKKLKLLEKVGLVESLLRKNMKVCRGKQRKYFKLTNVGEEVVEYLLKIDYILLNIK